MKRKLLENMEELKRGSVKIGAATEEVKVEKKQEVKALEGKKYEAPKKCEVCPKLQVLLNAFLNSHFTL